MLPPIAIGESDFVRIRRAGELYVDKTRFVAEVLRGRARVMLFCRPRRFGKTPNLRTLQAFVARSGEDVRPLFAGLAIEQAGPEIWAQFQRSPVIWLTLKDVKGRTWAETSSALASEIAIISDRFHAQIEPILTAREAAAYDRMRERGQLSDEHDLALRHLSEWLHRATGEPAFILIDEYDTPIHAAQSNGFLPEALAFFRRFFGAGLKDNPHLGRAVITGILRVAKESLFSDLNNLDVNTVLSDGYGDAFGFTEGEVSDLTDRAGLSASIQAEMRAFYDGYRIGGVDIYNPWSVTHFLRARTERPESYWINTSENTVIRELLVERGTVASPLIGR